MGCSTCAKRYKPTTPVQAAQMPPTSTPNELAQEKRQVVRRRYRPPIRKK